MTLTLPERTLEQLAAIDPDRARAIVKATERMFADASAAKPVEIVEVAPGKAVIVIGPCRSLRGLRWLRLAEIAPARYLLTIEPGTAVESLEVSLVDMIDDLPEGDDSERRVLSELLEVLRSLRREKAISKAEMLFVRTDVATR